MKFKNLSGERFTLSGVIESIYRTIEDKPSEKNEIIIGSDSQRYGSQTNYVTAIVLLLEKGGKVYYTKQRLAHNNRIDLSVRITQETAFTVEILQAIEKSILMDILGREKLSAHVDAGYTGKSKKIVDACVGWINSLGYDCQCKPEAYVASHVADKFTKRK